jgi:hypothetical protein
MTFWYSVKAIWGQIFQETIGSAGSDGSESLGYSVQQTSDGGYILAGYDGSSYVVKTDSNGTMQWNKTYGSGIAYSVYQTSDGGYILAVYSYAGYNIELVKTDSSGTIEWQKTYGNGIPCSVQQTSDGGYILAGSHSGGFYVVKTDSSGTIEWQKTYGNGTADYVYQTSDGGYILAGYDWVNADVELVKTDSSGTVQWNKTYGEGWGYSVQQTSDGGYILAGWSSVNSAAELVKTDSSGTIEWQKTYGNGIPCSVQQTSDGGYILAVDSGNYLGYNVELVKTDSSGTVQWNKTYGSGEAQCVQQTWDGGYIIVGCLINSGGYSYIFLVKTDKDGNSPAYIDTILGEGTSYVPYIVYFILHDPPGDDSYSWLEQGQTTSWDYTVSGQASAGVEFEVDANFFGSGVSAENGFKISVGGSQSNSVEISTSQSWTSSLDTTDAYCMGPGYGDVYVGDSWLLNYRIVQRTYLNGTQKTIVLYGPTQEEGFVWTAYQIKYGGIVPEPYRSAMLALDPAQDNEINASEASKLVWEGTISYTGGSSYSYNFSETSTNTRTSTFNVKMSDSLAIKLGFNILGVGLDGKATVSFSYDAGITSQTSTTTNKRTGYQIYDTNPNDVFEYTTWYDPVFGTFLFNASGRSAGLRGTSDPQELWDNGTDVGITSVGPAKTVIGQGYGTNIEVNVTNYGMYQRTFNTSIYANTTIIGTKTVTLPSGASTVVTLSWNTSGFAYGCYIISAIITLAPGETNSGTGEFTYGTVKVTIPGDINGDGVVNIFDLGIITGNWQQTVPPAPANADILDVGVINIFDLGVVTAHWMMQA